VGKESGGGENVLILRNNCFLLEIYKNIRNFYCYLILRYNSL